MDKRKRPGWLKLILTPTLPFFVIGFVAGLIWVPIEAGFMTADNLWRRHFDG